MYAKDSMDRFGDDMCEHILSYLSLEDRFRCECVSKQWQRLVYTTVRHITISREPLLINRYHFDGYFYDKKIVAIMKKCSNIESIDCRNISYDKHNRRIVETIAELRDNCRQLRRIYGNFLGFNGIEDYLFDRFGPFITELDLKINSNRREVIPLCPHVCRLSVSYITDVFTESGAELVVKNLRHFEFYFDTDFDVSMFDTFVTQNQSLMSLTLTVR
jgi:hypothetical protein